MRGGGVTRTFVVLVVCGFLAPEVPAKRGKIVYQGIERHAAQVSTMWGTHANAIGRMLDGAVMTEAQAVRESEEAKAARAHAPSTGVCEGAEGFRGAGASRAFEASRTDAGGDALTAWFAHDTVRVPGLSAPADLRARVDEVFERYCAPGRMVGAGAACRGAYEDHAADLRPGAVLGVGTFVDEKSATAGIDWVRNIAMPLPERAMPLGSARSVAARRIVLARRGRDARGALATWNLLGRVSARLPAASAGDWASSIGVGGGDGRESNISHHELLGMLSRERFEPPGKFAQRHGENRANLIREWIVSEGTSLMLAFEQYRDAERQGAMLAARLAQVLLHHSPR